MRRRARFENVDRAENIIGRAGVRVFLNSPADQPGGVDHRVDVEFFQRAQQRRQIAHVGGDDIGFVFADDFLDVIAIGREIEKHDFVAGVDGMCRAALEPISPAPVMRMFMKQYPPYSPCNISWRGNRGCQFPMLLTCLERCLKLGFIH